MYKIKRAIRVLTICLIGILYFPLVSNGITVENNHILKIGCIDFKNMVYKNANGENKGYAIDYLGEIEKNSDYKFEIISESEKKLQKKLKKGEIDLIFLGRKGNIDSYKFDYSEREIGISNANIYVKSDKDVYYEDYKKFNNYKVGICSESIKQQFKKYEKVHNFKTTVIVMNNYSENEKALDDENVDMIITEQMNYSDSYKLVGKFSMSPLYAYTLKDSKKITIFNELQRELYKEKNSIVSKLNFKYYNNIKLIKPIFTRNEHEYLTKVKPISIAIRGHKPFVWKQKNGELKGIYINALNILAENLGMKFNYKLIDKNQKEQDILKKNRYYMYSENYVKNYEDVEANKVVIFDMPYVYIKIRNKDINFDSLKSIAIENKDYNLAVKNKLLENSKKINIVDYKNTIDIVDSVDKGEIETAILQELEIPYLFRFKEFDDLTTVKNNDFIGKLIIKTSVKDDILFSCINKELNFIGREALYKQSDQNLDTFKMDFNEFLNKYKQEIFILMLIIIVIILLLNVWQRKRLLLKIEESRKKAEKANNAKSLFLANMSHDIRTPLNAIIGFIDIALEEVNDIKSVEYFTKIKQSGLYLLMLLNDILEMSRIESGKIKLTKIPVDIRGLSQTIFEIIVPQANVKQIKFYLDCSDLKYDYQYVDEIRLKQIIINVLNNAIKYTKKGGYVKFKIENISKKNNILYTRYTIKDNGVGISENFKNKLFDAFEKEKNSESQKEGGTGLGLAITKKLLNLMKGSIVVHSEVGKGSIFIIDIPTKIVSKEKFQLSNIKNKENVDNKFESQADLSNLKNIKILIAEDNDINAKIVCKILENMKINNVRVKNGKEVLEFLKEDNDYDLILMDVRMPILDGLETTKIIRNSDDKKIKQIPIVGLSANAFSEDILLAKEIGMNDYISKPIDLMKFKKILIKNIKSKKNIK